MKKRYNQIMENIQITDEMRDRILSNLQKADLEEKRPAKVVRFPTVKKYLPIAACFIVLLVSAITIPNLLNVRQSENPGITASGSGIVEVASAEELSKAVGFEVTDVDSLPFTEETRTYMDYWNELAEICYSGQGQTAVFRKSMGGQDNSGDYNSYGQIKEISVGNRCVTLKGDDDLYVLAVWFDGEFSYSLRLSAGSSENSWIEILSGIGG